MDRPLNAPLLRAQFCGANKCIRCILLNWPFTGDFSSSEKRAVRFVDVEVPRLIIGFSHGGLPARMGVA